jgi:hypothetical protein
MAGKLKDRVLAEGRYANKNTTKGRVTCHLAWSWVSGILTSLYVATEEVH